MAVLLSMLEKKERDDVNMDTRLWKNENYWVSGYNFDPETVAGHHISDNLKIHDATLRDGEQTPGVVLRKEEKVRIAQLLDEAGVQRIEAGMPAVSDEDKLAIAEIKRRGLKAEIFGIRAGARIRPDPLQGMRRGRHRARGADRAGRSWNCSSNGISGASSTAAWPPSARPGSWASR